MKILDNIQKYLFFWIIGAIFLGLTQVIVFGGYAFSPLICFLAALIMIYPSLVPLDFGRLKESLKNYNLILISLFINFIISPLLAVSIGYLFFQENPILWLGLIMLSLLPGGGMATTWALKSKTDMPSVVGIIIFNLLAAILVAPLALSYAMDKIDFDSDRSTLGGVCPVENISGGILSCGVGEINHSKIALAIFFIVVVPLLVAYITQIIIKNKKGHDYFEKIKLNFGKFSNLGLVIILFILMGIENNKVIFSDPNLISRSILPLIWYYVIITGTVLAIYFKFFRNNRGKSIVWGSYLRYITLALGLSTSFILQDATLSIMTIPIILSYFIQIPGSFWLAKYLTEK